MDKFWRKWQFWPKNVITQIFQRPYNLISILETTVGPDGEDTMKNLRKTFAGIFGDMS